jgi:hypothetical protein
MRAVIRSTLGVTVAIVIAVTVSADSGRGVRFDVTDDCDPTDTTFPGAGCLRTEGEVTNAEFGAALPQGHPSWRIDPPYVEDRQQRDIRVRNTGGRDHTFTKVARFGNGFVPPLNAQGVLGQPVFNAPECAGGVANPAVATSFLAPGAELRIEDLQPGTHNFQCCIHPWMRTVVKVDERGSDHDNH